MKKLLGIFAFFLSIQLCFGNLTSYRPLNTPQTGVNFSIPYTFGTHKGHAEKIYGKIEFDRNHIEGLRGHFKVPVKSMRTGKSVRDCHLVEALGLDYTSSRFPENHVCNNDNELERDEAAHFLYPFIHFKIIDAKKMGEEQTDAFHKYGLIVTGLWTIHGREVSKSHKVELTVDLKKRSLKLRIKTTPQFSLKEFDVIVKPAKILGIKIGVKDNVSVDLDLVLNEVQ